jgi:hypothetical protein
MAMLDSPLNQTLSQPGMRRVAMDQMPDDIRARPKTPNGHEIDQKRRSALA